MIYIAENIELEIRSIVNITKSIGSFKSYIKISMVTLHGIVDNHCTRKIEQYFIYS